LARNVLDQAQTLISLKQWGVELISVDEPISDDTAARKLSRNILGSMNQFFSDSLSEKTKFRMAAGVKEGRWLWVAPLGDLNEAGTKRVVLDPARAGLVRKSFELIIEKDYTTAFNLIRSLNLTTRTGRSIPKQTFSRMVRNEFYAGVITSGNVRIPGLHEALITEEMFHEVQAKLKGKSAHQKDHEEFPFRGFILCAQCHKPLTAGMCRGRHQTYARYWCHRKGCTTSVSKFDAEGLFCFGLEFAQPSMEPVARLPEVAASMWTTRKDQISDESKILSRRLAEQNELNRKTILARVNGVLSDDDFKVLKLSITEELTRITKAIEALDAEKSSYTALMQEAKEDVVDLRAAWEKGSLHRKHELQWALFPEGLEWWMKKNACSRLPQSHWRPRLLKV
jgi:site-specific DNA recombinase